ncbi:methyltransferase domain-containing protein [Halorientalis pallida]|uniref:Class I SAM-dependent methyltransferase n=1 Tax=Halorientalis pallida TaxID=2479928 RepID=A0A498L439_9EURY|nr:methyltransferase domain-containing protein [Halorientalis pallida]RXK49062.1 class I SAM-dependent methyltransferase [Halorientalis pallida]
MTSAFGQALLDHHRGERETPLRQRDGEASKVHPVEDFYFGGFPDEPAADWVRSWLDGPLLDLGAGAGRDALHFRDRFETVALDVDPALVTLMDERGVADARRGDMFALPEQFERDRFRSVLCIGTQLGLSKSMQGLRSLLADLAHVTTADGTVVVDGYDPTYEGAADMLGFRADPTPGLAFRVVTYEYGGRLDPTLLFRLVSPDRLREATTGTDWHVADVRRPHDAYYYRAALEKA